MSQKIILTLCLLLVITLTWSQSDLVVPELDIKALLESVRFDSPNAETVHRLVGSWNDTLGNSVIFDADGSCRFKRTTDRDYDSWKLYQAGGGHFLSYYRRNGCRPIMRCFGLSFSDDGQTLILKGYEEGYQLTRQ